MITTTVVIDLKQLIKCITERKLPDDMKILSGVKLPDELKDVDIALIIGWE